MAYNTTEQEYYQYIQGNEYYEGMENIVFDDVTINPTHFYVGDRLLWKNGTSKAGWTHSDHVNELPSVTFAGSYYGYPMLCYGFTLPGKDVKYGYFALNTTVLSPWGRFRDDPDICFKQIGIGFHLPGQTILSLQSITKVCVQNTINMERWVDLRITILEIVKRRDKLRSPCMKDHKNYDHTIANELIDKIGCIPPYMQSKRNGTLCNTIEKLREAHRTLDLGSIPDRLTPPCLSIGTISHSTDAYNTYPWYMPPNVSWFSFAPPNKIKIINQVKDVHIQTVIGNAGGYVGLFLGKS